MNTLPLFTLIARDVELKRTASTHGGEYSSPCPLDCYQGRLSGRDHFKYWRSHHGQERWACLGPKAGRSGCDKGGDAIQYLRERDHLTYPEACAHLGMDLGQDHGRGMRSGGTQTVVAPIAPSAGPCAPSLTPPNMIWQSHANGHAARCAAQLWTPAGARALSYLHARGLFDDVLRAHNVGYNPTDTWEDHAWWGLPKPDQGAKRIWLPRGITFPWYINGTPWRLNIRRPLTPKEAAAGEAKYIGPAGFANALYNADSLVPRGGTIPPAVLVEGEIDALTIVQACGAEVAAVATGSTAGSRRGPWIAQLAVAPVVLVAFDADTAGDGAAAWWLDILPHALRWRPPLHDVNTLPDPDAVALWVRRGLAAAQDLVPSQRPVR